MQCYSYEYQGLISLKIQLYGFENINAFLFPRLCHPKTSGISVIFVYRALKINIIYNYCIKYIMQKGVCGIGNRLAEFVKWGLSCQEIKCV